MLQGLLFLLKLAANLVQNLHVNRHLLFLRMFYPILWQVYILTITIIIILNVMQCLNYCTTMNYEFIHLYSVMFTYTLLNILILGNNLRFELFKPMHDMWKAYILELLEKSRLSVLVILLFLIPWYFILSSCKNYLHAWISSNFYVELLIHSLIVLFYFVHLNF